MNSYLTQARLFYILLIPMVFLLVGCPEKPVFTGTGETFVTSGSSDDGDDQATGPAKNYVNPNRTSADGQSVALSDPQSYRSLKGNVTAQTGPQPIRTATAVSTNKVTSTFEVEEREACKFKLSSTATVTLNSGVGGFLVAVRILDSNGQYVDGTDFQTRYDFKENVNGKIDVTRNNQQLSQINNGGSISPNDKGPASEFTLEPGTYTLLFELNVDSKADTRAKLDVIATVIGLI